MVSRGETSQQREPRRGNSERENDPRAGPGVLLSNWGGGRADEKRWEWEFNLEVGAQIYYLKKSVKPAGSRKTLGDGGHAVLR